MSPEKMDNGNIKIKFMESDFEKDLYHLNIDRDSALTFSYPEKKITLTLSIWKTKGCIIENLLEKVLI